MKKTVLLFTILVLTINSRASHQQVLELFYDHIPGTNKYIFTLVEQVEPQTTVVSTDVASNSPAGTIYLTRVQSIPLSGNCTLIPWGNIYRSDTIDLGPIPTAGYTFGHNTCCRRTGIDNIQNSASKGFYIEAKMFPEPGQNYASSSPRFANIAHSSWLQQSPFTLSEPAIDPDGDSIFYTLIDVREGTLASNVAISYYNGFSGSAPLGTANPITINQARGVFTATNTIPLGVYQFNIQITSLKNNVITSVIHRDLITYVFTNPPVAPAISLTNYNGVGPLVLKPNGVYEITIKPTDSVSFNINGTIASDSIYLAGTSRLFDVSNNTAGNCSGNCADFTPNPNLSGIANATGKFSFLADSTHLLGADTAKYNVVFLAASQGKCMPVMFENFLVDVVVVKNSGIGITENQRLQFKVYPNPTTGILQIESPFTQKKEVRLLNAMGQELERFVVHEGESRIDLSNFAKGLYFLVDEEDGSQRVVLQ